MDASLAPALAVLTPQLVCHPHSRCCCLKKSQSVPQLKGEVGAWWGGGEGVGAGRRLVGGGEGVVNDLDSAYVFRCLELSYWLKGLL